MACGWPHQDNPQLFSTSFKYKLSQLPKQGRLDVSGWSDTYWPSYESGIAHRWNADDPQDFNYTMLTKIQLLNATKDQLRQLSPAEKFDIYTRRYDYPTVRSEWSRTSADDPTWEGICHGWSPAALAYKQPNPAELTNPDGITIPFGSSDVKALLSYYVGQYDSNSETKFVGLRCDIDLDDHPENSEDEECFDMDPGAWHVLVANQIGLMKQGFVIDRVRDQQVWNQPFDGFQSNFTKLHLPRENCTEGTAKSVHVKTTISYSKEVAPAWDPEDPYVVDEPYEYYLDLDKKGNIIGGGQVTWRRTDFAWSQSPNKFYGYFAKLQDIYQASIKAAAPTPGLDVVSEHANKGKTHTDLNMRSGKFSLKDYQNSDHVSWSIGSTEARDAKLKITFKNVDTERIWDKIMVYEGQHGLGPLVAVLHGQHQLKEVLVNSPQALVVFKADRQYMRTGFAATFETIEQSIPALKV
jgi:hypothetical protein